MSILAMALMVSGCGSGEEDEGPVSASLARQADGSCAAVNRQTGRELLRAYNTEPIRKAANEQEGISLETELLMPIFIRNAEVLAAKFRALAPASEDAEQVNSIVSAYGDWIEEAKEAPGEVVLRNDVFNEARRLAGEYGMKQCAQSPFEVNRGGLRS